MAKHSRVNENKRKEFGHRLEAYRKMAHLTQEQLGKLIADKSGKAITRKAIYNWETGSTYPTEANMKLLARALKKPIEILTGELPIDIDTKNYKKFENLYDDIFHSLSESVLKIGEFYGYDTIFEVDDDLREKLGLREIHNNVCFVICNKPNIQSKNDVQNIRDSYLYLSAADLTSICHSLIDFIWIMLNNKSIQNRDLAYDYVKERFIEYKEKNDRLFTDIQEENSNA